MHLFATVNSVLNYNIVKFRAKYNNQMLNSCLNLLRNITFDCYIQLGILTML